MRKMNSRNTRNSYRPVLEDRTGAVTFPEQRPLLDAHLGLSLWKSRRIAPATKLLAVLLGMAVVFALVAVACLIAIAVDGRTAAGAVSLSPVPLSSGALLFGTISLLRLAPAHVIRLTQLELNGAIPLRKRSG
jgi:hypothetical protein